MALDRHRLYRKDAGLDDPLLVSTKGARMIYRSLFEKIQNLGRQSVFVP